MSKTGKDSTKFDLEFFCAHHGRLFEGRHNGKLKQMYLADWDRDTQAVTLASHQPDPYHEFALHEVEDLVLLPKDSTDFVYDHTDWYIQATVSGIQGVFYAAEHFNIGRGWMMLERDGRIQGVVPCSSLKNPLALEERKKDVGGGKATTHADLVIRETIARGQVYLLEDPVEYVIPFARSFSLHGEFPEENVIPFARSLLLQGECREE